jgi:hypothetical protein
MNWIAPSIDKRFSMKTTRNLVSVVFLGASLLILSGANAQVLRSKELICSGTVTYGQKTFSDQIVLRFSNHEVGITGESGKISTFEGMLRYKICFESEDEMDFEYTTSPKCGSNATRSGRLHKFVGSLRLSRSDRGEPFVGDYKCKSAQRVLD